MNLRIKTSRISDLVESGQRSDWSHLSKIIQELQPGQVVEIECPSGITIPKFRSTILTYGRRCHSGEWSLSTRTKGKIISCFLAPTS